MPAGQSKVGICNIALIELGEDPLPDLTGNNKTTILCNARYDDSRQAVIREHPWNCTKKLVQLSADNTPPLFKYSSSYTLPADFLRMFNLADNPEASWEIVGTKLLTDETAPLNLIYHYDLQDTTVFDALMARCIGYNLALEIGPALIRDDAKMKRIADKLEARIVSAKLVDSQEDSPQEWDTDILLRSRR